MSIDVGNHRALRTLDKSWRASDTAERAHRRVNATGNQFKRFGEQFV
jgi:hypothetical protein